MVIANVVITAEFAAVIWQDRNVFTQKTGTDIVGSVVLMILCFLVMLEMIRIVDAMFLFEAYKIFVMVMGNNGVNQQNQVGNQNETKGCYFSHHGTKIEKLKIYEPQPFKNILGPIEHDFAVPAANIFRSRGVFFQGLLNRWMDILFPDEHVKHS